MHAGTAAEQHAHTSADVVVGSAHQPLVARLVRTRDDGPVHVLLNDRTATIDEVGRFMGGLRGLLDQGVPAEPGLGFVRHLASEAHLSVREMAMVAGLPYAAVQAQSEGHAALSVAEFDRLALAVARRVAEALLRTA